jgi:hypothetical protein
MEHLRCDGVEQHPRSPADLLLRQRRHLGILPLHIPSSTLLTSHTQPNERWQDARNYLP